MQKENLFEKNFFITFVFFAKKFIKITRKKFYKFIFNHCLLCYLEIKRSIYLKKMKNLTHFNFFYFNCKCLTFKSSFFCKD